MNERDIKQLLQSMERLINTARWLHGQHLVVLHKPWEGHTAITEAGGIDLPCESCGNINQAEYELATAYAYTQPKGRDNINRRDETRHHDEDCVTLCNVSIYDPDCQYTHGCWCAEEAEIATHPEPMGASGKIVPR